jgi:hypothetical protein
VPALIALRISRFIISIEDDLEELELFCSAVLWGFEVIYFLLWLSSGVALLISLNIETIFMHFHLKIQIFGLTLAMTRVRMTCKIF